jgi:7,8-dihydropterin-6-yl-methyl-4-(beta-D-ribofuranosyl)aminobenzene 5'-phosphate synthase
MDARTSEFSRCNQDKLLIRELQHIMDERYAAIDVKGKGLVIFTAYVYSTCIGHYILKSNHPRCSHAGVVNVVRDAIKQFTRPIHMVVGGLHLGGPELYDRIEPTVHFLSQRIRPAPTYVLPMHCSGFPVKVALQKELGEGCIPAGTGMVCEILAGSQELDERLSVSIK